MEKVRGSIVILRDGEPVESNVTEDADFCVTITMTDNKGKIEINVVMNGYASKYMLVEGLANAVAKMMLGFVIQTFLTGKDICNFLQILGEKLDRKTE